MSNSRNPKNLTDEVIEGVESKPHPAVGDWDLVGKPLGSGAYGVAFLATKTRRIGRKNIKIRGAIKLVNLENGALRSHVYALVDELTKLATFNSRYIANLIDAGTFTATSGLTLPYFVMDYIEGESLQEILERIRKKDSPRLQPALFKNLAINTLRALLVAHQAKILHLDIKPANVMLSAKDETFVLIDFGVSKIIEHDILDGFYGGTPGYIAPEVYLQKAVHASDVFSLGLTLYEALTLERPFLKQARLLLKENPKADPQSTKFIQTATKNIEFDFSLITDDQRALIEPMVCLEPKKRLSVDELIELANKLHIPDNSSPKISQSNQPPEIYQSWEKMGEHITKMISNSGIGRTHIVVDDTNHFRLWFKTQLIGEVVEITCPSPKNSIALGKLGWNPGPKGIHGKLVDGSVEAVSDAILKAMKIGLSLKPPVSVTREHSS